MSLEGLDEILQKGIYGQKETLPEERHLFLNTITERIYLALTNNQVRKRGLYREAEEIMKNKKDKTIHLLINGELNYSYYSNYVKVATKYAIPFTIVSDNHETPIGIILASDSALTEKKEFFIKDDEFFFDFPHQKD